MEREKKIWIAAASQTLLLANFDKSGLMKYLIPLYAPAREVIELY